MKVVINECFGGFGLSDEAVEWLIKNKGWKTSETNEKGNMVNPEAPIMISEEFTSLIGKYYLPQHYEESFRANPDVIEVVEKLGEKANARFAKLVVVEIPDNVEWEINDYDGNESIEEKHRSWR